MISQLFHVVLLQRVSSMTLLNSGRKEQVELPIPKLILSSKTLPGALTFNTSLPTWNKSPPVRELTIKTFNGWIWLMNTSLSGWEQPVFQTSESSGEELMKNFKLESTCWKSPTVMRSNLSKARNRLLSQPPMHLEVRTISWQSATSPSVLFVCSLPLSSVSHTWRREITTQAKISEYEW